MRVEGDLLIVQKEHQETAPYVLYCIGLATGMRDPEPYNAVERRGDNFFALQVASRIGEPYHSSFTYWFLAEQVGSSQIRVDWDRYRRCFPESSREQLTKAIHDSVWCNGGRKLEITREIRKQHHKLELGRPVWVAVG